MKFGLKFRELRAYYKITQTELANICEVSRHVISQIELEHNNPSLILINKLSIHYHITRDYFFEGEMEIAGAYRTLNNALKVEENDCHEKEELGKVNSEQNLSNSNELSHSIELIKEKDELIESLKRELKKSDEIIELLKRS